MTHLSDIQWLQASLPIKEGGLGLRRVASLALPASLASSTSTLSLQDALLTFHPCPSDSISFQYSNTWVSRFGILPAGFEGHKQSSWDLPGIAADKSQIMQNLLTPRDNAIFLAATANHLGAWLSAIPIAAAGYALMMKPFESG